MLFSKNSPSLFISLTLFFLTLQYKSLSTVAQSNLITETSPENDLCAVSIIDRFQQHRVVGGETLESIAIAHSLIPETLIRINPILETKPLSIGQEILIPPMNGALIQAPQGVTWKDLETAYGVRADVLFELNGCQAIPRIVFLPGVNWGSPDSSFRQYTGLSGYPLPFRANIGLSYGWYNLEENGQKRFHGGIDLLAPIGTNVLNVEPGIIAFAESQGNYGNLVVVNHQGGKQTRYAHLETITVNVGQSVEVGTILGTVGVTGSPDLTQSHLHFEIRYNSPSGWVAQDPQIHFQD
jgi:murein DD-endopeptidase MepM/ murein hydrolase activator NlpD